MAESEVVLSPRPVALLAPGAVFKVVDVVGCFEVLRHEGAYTIIRRQGLPEPSQRLLGARRVSEVRKTSCRPVETEGATLRGTQAARFTRLCRAQ